MGWAQRCLGQEGGSELRAAVYAETRRREGGDLRTTRKFQGDWDRCQGLRRGPDLRCTQETAVDGRRGCRGGCWGEVRGQMGEGPGARVAAAEKQLLWLGGPRLTCSYGRARPLKDGSSRK